MIQIIELQRLEHHQKEERRLLIRFHIFSVILFLLNYRLLLENITYISSFLVPQPMIGDETRDFYRINPQS